MECLGCDTSDLVIEPQFVGRLAGLFILFDAPIGVLAADLGAHDRARDGRFRGDGFAADAVDVSCVEGLAVGLHHFEFFEETDDGSPVGRFTDTGVVDGEDGFVGGR